MRRAAESLRGNYTSSALPDQHGLADTLLNSRGPIGEAQGRFVEGLRQSRGLFNLYLSPLRRTTNGCRGPPCTHTQVKDKGAAAAKHSYKDTISSFRLLLPLNSLRSVFSVHKSRSETVFQTRFFTSKQQRACRCLLLLFYNTQAHSSFAPQR